MYLINKFKYHGLHWFLRRVGRELLQPTTRLGTRFKLITRPLAFCLIKPLNVLIYFKQSKQASKDSLCFFYDFEVEPVTYDFVWALCSANARRQAFGLSVLHVILVPGTMNGLRQETADYELAVTADARHWRIYSILIPALRLLTCRYRLTICATRDEALFLQQREAYFLYPEKYNVIFPTTYAPTDAVKYAQQMLCLSADNQALAYISAWKKQYVGDKKLIVITLRQYAFSPLRNSNLDAWAKFAAGLDKSAYFVVFVPDTEVALNTPASALSAYDFFYPATWNINLRAALYELAYLNLGVNTGPMSLCWFNARCRYITFKTFSKEVAQASMEVMLSRGFVFNESPLFTNRFQKWVWAEDDYDMILREFQLMSTLIEEEG